MYLCCLFCFVIVQELNRLEKSEAETQAKLSALQASTQATVTVCSQKTIIIIKVIYILTKMLIS